jgi:hypothetical protein
MSWCLKQDAKGQYWLFDPQAAANVINGCAYISAFIKHAHPKTVDHSIFTKSFQTVEFDAGLIRQSKLELAKRYHQDVMSHLERGNGHDAFGALSGYRKVTRNFRREHAALFAQAHQSFRTSDQLAYVCTTLAQVTRDTAVAGIAIVAVPMGTGAMLVGAVASSVGTGICKYQDTHNVEAALVAGTGALVMCGVGVVGNAVKTSGRAAQAVTIVGGVVLDGSFEYIGAKAEKKSDTEAMKAALTKSIFSALGSAVDRLPVASKLDDMMDTTLAKAAKLADSQKDQIAGLNKVLARVAAGKVALDGVKKSGEKALIELSRISIDSPAAARLPIMQEGDYVRANVLRPVKVKL